MPKYDRLPPIQDLRFIPANEELPAAYNSWPFDSGFHERRIREYQYNRSYQQKRNYSDWITFYVDTLAPNIKVHLLDEDGTTLVTEDFAGGYAAYEPGNTAPSGDPYYTFVGRFQPQSFYEMPVGLSQQVYYVVIECEYPGDGESVFYVSEPLFVRKSYWEPTATGGRTNGGWPGTQLLEFRNTVNNFDILFEQIPNLVFRQRVESCLEFQEATMNDTTFEDQQFRVRTLQSVPGRAYNYRAGGDEGIPDYLIDRINRGMSCDNFRIESVRYTKTKSAKWSLSAPEGYPLKTATISVEEYDVQSMQTYSAGSPTTILEAPYDVETGPIYPWAFNFLGISNGISYIELSLRLVFDDESEVLALLSTLNSSVLPVEGLTGTLELQDGYKIVYNNGTGEAYGPALDMYTMYKYMMFRVQYLLTGPDATWKFQLASPDPSYAASCVVDWGDGTYEYPFAGSTFLDVIHTYAGAALPYDIYVRIFHRGDELDVNTYIHELNFPATALDGTAIKEVSAGLNIEAPARLRSFQMNGHSLTAVPEVDFSMLAKAHDYLEKIEITTCDVGILSNFNPILLDFAGDPIFTVLKVFSIAGNHISSSDIDLQIQEIQYHVTPSPIKIITLKFQSPAAPPISPMMIALVAYWTGTLGWTVNTD